MKWRHILPDDTTETEPRIIFDAMWSTLHEHPGHLLILSLFLTMALDYLDTDPWAQSSAQQRLEFAILGPQMQEEVEQLNLAIAQSLAELDKPKSSPKDNILNAMEEIKADPTKQHLMKAKFANTKRAFGFGQQIYPLRQN